MKITDFTLKKQRQEKISMLTCYDYSSALIIAKSHLDCVLVGDSVAMVVHGHKSTIMATIDMMVLHTEAVARGLEHQLLISDLPFLCHRISKADTIGHVRRLLQAGAHAIKIEGGDDDTCETIHHLVASGVPVIGHIGLMPQHYHQLGGHRVQGRDEKQANNLLMQAKSLAQAGCAALVIECIPSPLAQVITQSLAIPTIGIGAGMATDGQVLVWHDMLGLIDGFRPRFLKQFAPLSHDLFLAAINTYVSDVKLALFPTADHSF